MTPKFLVFLWMGVCVLLVSCATATPTPNFPTLIPSPTPPPEAIALPYAVTGTLTLDERQKRWQFYGGRGAALTLTLEGAGFFASLYAPDGARVTQGAGWSAVLPSDGIYVLELQLREGLESSYTLRLEAQAPTPSAQPPTPTAMPFAAQGIFQAALDAADAPVFGALNDPYTEHIYTFEARANAYAQITLQRTSGTVDPLLTLLAPDGSALAIDDNSGGGRTARLNVRLPQAGRYGLQVYGKGFGGTYELRLILSDTPFEITPQAVSLAPTATPVPIVLTPTLFYLERYNRYLLPELQPLQGVLSRPGEINSFRIAGINAGDVFTLGVRPLNGTRLTLEVYTPSSTGGDAEGGVLLAQVNTTGADGEYLVLDAVAPTSGEYIVLVIGAPDSVGEYVIGYGRGSIREDVRKAEMLPDRRYEGQVINRRAVRDVWYLPLKTGDFINVTAASEDGRFLPVLELLAPDGRSVASALNTEGSLTADLRARADSNGRYTLRVRGADASQFGIYALIWRYIEAAPQPTPPPTLIDLLTLEDTLSSLDGLSYPLLGLAGQQLLITVNSEVGSGFDPLVELLDADGNVIASDDDSGGDLNPRLTVTLPTDGRYRVRVNGYNTLGAFTLRVQEVR